MKQAKAPAPGAPVEPVPQMAATDPLPVGPYRLGLTQYGWDRVAPPWTIKAANGQCVAGWIDSHQCAVAIAAALNLQFPTAL